MNIQPKTHRRSSTLIFTALLSLAVSTLVSSASAQVIVTTDPNATQNNFGNPGTSNAVGYTITMSSDANDINLSFVTTTPVSPDFNLNFTNLYFSTTVAEPVNPGHSTLGFEIENNRAFIPGGTGTQAGYFSTVTDGFAVTTAPGNIQVSIPWTYFETDPQGAGFDKITPANNIVRLNLSQSFGYSVAGGLANYGPTELGEATLPVAAPEPSTWATLVAGLVMLFTLPRFWRTRKSFV